MIMIAGIDPGLNGAISLIDAKGKFRKMYSGFALDVGNGRTKSGRKKVNNVPDEYMITKAVRKVRTYASQRGCDLIVLLEKQQVMSKQGVVSSGKIMLGYGIWMGALAALRIRFSTIHPRTWQMSILRDAKGNDTKARSLFVARRLFPKVDLHKKGDHDKADSLLIAEYCRRNFLQGEGL